MSRGFIIALTIGLCSLLLLCLIGDTGVLEVPVQLFIGWGWYIAQVLPQVRVEWHTLLSTIVFAILFGIGLHWLCGWVYRERHGAGNGAKWRVRWTMASVALVLLMFIAGTAAVGAVHQVVFLATSQEPLFHAKGMREPANVVKCASNLRMIGQSLAYYRKQNGQYPASLTVLQQELSENLDRRVLNCPAEPVGSEKKVSYIYVRTDLAAPLSSDDVVAYEPLSNHGGRGMNILFGDGRVEFLEPDRAVELLDAQGQ